MPQGNGSDLPERKQLATAVREAAAEQGVSERRLRRWVAAIALIEVFNIGRTQGLIPPFMVKGGSVLELRFHSRSRASRDVDFVLETNKSGLMDAAAVAMRIAWSGFTFRIKGEAEEREHSYKFEVNALYRDRDWSTFEVELTDGEVANYETIEAFDVAALGLQRSSTIPCMNVFVQIAQKLHAVSDPNENRPRDLIDVYLLDTSLERDDEALRAACEAVFEERGTHPWPPPIDLRDGWPEALEELIERNGLELTVEAVADGVRSILVRLVGVNVVMNYQYHFLVLSGQSAVPNVLQNALQTDEAFNTMKRMTEEEGWRLAHVMPYPAQERQGRAVLAILEKPKEE